MKSADPALAFSYDLVSIGKRMAAFFRPYPSLLDVGKRVYGKPIYIEVSEEDEPYPFARRSDLRGRSWWDLRYVVTEDRLVIAPTILTRDFAVEMLGLSVDNSILGRHLVAFSTEVRLVSLDPFTAIDHRRKDADFLSRLDSCIKALGLHDMKVGLTGSLLIDEELSATDRDLDLVVEGDQTRIKEIATKIGESFLNRKYNEIWPLRAVLGDDIEVDLFFPPPRDVIKTVSSFKPSGLELEPFTVIVDYDHFSLYAPTVLKCDEIVCIVLGTVVRGQFQCGDYVSGCGIPGSVTFEGSRIKAYLVEDATTHLENSPRRRKVTD